MDQKRPTAHARAKCCSAQLLLFPSPDLLCLRERVREVQSTQMFAETFSNILGRIFLRTYTNKYYTKSKGIICIAIIRLH